MKKRTATLLLLITAMVWGMGFVAQDVAADALGPFSFNGTRMLLAAVALLHSQVLFYYLPVLMVAGVLAGALIGLVAGLITERIQLFLRNS